MIFTTPTGQTGMDAYTFEAAQIANELRDLDERFKALVTAVRTEHPEFMQASSDYAFSGAEGAMTFTNYLRLSA